MGRFVGGMTWGKFLAGYAAALALGLAAALWLRAAFGLGREQAVMLVTAALFAWAAVGRPRYVYLLVRNIGWFSGVESDRAMRATLAALAGALLLGAALAG